MEEEQPRHQLEMQEREVLSICPSFNSYSSNRSAEIAAKVIRESETSNDDSDFEFSFVRTDEIFRDGQIRPLFPIFSRDLFIDQDDQDQVDDVTTLKLPLENLLLGKREEEVDPPSSSSSEADEFEHLSPKTYCVWRPAMVESSPGGCKKSNSTGSALKRWTIRDLLRRSHSDGKESLVFLTPNNREQIKSEKIGGCENSKGRRSSLVFFSPNNRKQEANKISGCEKTMDRRNSGDGPKGAAIVKAKGVSAGGEKRASSAHEKFYVQNRAAKEGDKRKSYLPYRPELVGFFANVHGAGRIRNFPPF